jgi:hypothetical protein
LHGAAKPQPKKMEEENRIQELKKQKRDDNSKFFGKKTISHEFAEAAIYFSLCLCATAVKKSFQSGKRYDC